MKIRLIFVVVLTGLLFFTGCAPTFVWTSYPKVRTLENEHFIIQLRPLKQGENIYSSFQLDIRNRSRHELTIDWNKTRYIHNGNNGGPFVFQGIDPEDLKNGTIPADSIRSGKSIVKQIGPAKFVAFNPYRKASSTPNEKRLSFGLLPEGENSVALSVKVNGQWIHEVITVRLAASQSSP